MTKRLKRRWRKWLRQYSKGFYAEGFNALVKSGGTVVLMLVEDMPRNDVFFSMLEYHMFHVLYPFVTCLLTSSYFDVFCATYEFHSGARLIAGYGDSPLYIIFMAYTATVPYFVLHGCETLVFRTLREV
jgi:hypothetical protein